jgi:hypothetical protein
MAGPSSPNGAATKRLDLHMSAHLRLQIALSVPPAPIPVPRATAPTHARAVSGGSVSTVGHLTGDRGFESISLQRRVRCEHDFRPHQNHNKQRDEDQGACNGRGIRRPKSPSITRGTEGSNPSPSTGEMRTRLPLPARGFASFELGAQGCGVGWHQDLRRDWRGESAPDSCAGRIPQSPRDHGRGRRFWLEHPERFFDPNEWNDFVSGCGSRQAALHNISVVETDGMAWRSSTVRTSGFCAMPWIRSRCLAGSRSRLWRGAGYGDCLASLVSRVIPKAL